jgi:hypothetical protein
MIKKLACPLSIAATLTVIGCNSIKPEPAQLTYVPETRCGGLIGPWTNARYASPPHLLIINRIRLTRESRMSWNDRMVSSAELAQNLSVAGTMEIKPWMEMIVEDGTPCESVNSVRKMAIERKACDNGCAEFTQRDWTDVQPPPPPSE